MSDSSDNDLFPSNVFTFQNGSTSITAKGPNINSTNITNLSFRNNVLTSTMQMPRNFERQRYEPSFDQRSLYYQRATSPVSMYSGSVMRGRNFNHSLMSSHRSMYNGRSGSPISVRSIGLDSNASVSATDIAMALRNANFKKHELRVIKDAYNKFVKTKFRRKIEKRRKIRSFLKCYSPQSGSDSEEQSKSGNNFRWHHKPSYDLKQLPNAKNLNKSGSDSGEYCSDASISSDDCKSTALAANTYDRSSCRSTRTDFRGSIRDSNMYKDCTDNLKNNAFKNMFSMPPTHSNNRLVSQNPMLSGTMTQRDRFKTGFLLPSQRFNKSMASVPIPEKNDTSNKLLSLDSRKKRDSQPVNHKNMNPEVDSEQEEIFTERTVRERSTYNIESQCNKVTKPGKRSLESEDNNNSASKRTKLSSPVIQNKKKPSRNKVANILKEQNNNNKVQPEKKIEDFEFVKPQFPAVKLTNRKVKEKLISKSAAPLSDTILPPQNVTVEEQPATEQHSNSDVSMRPSFIKRKLFTQKMDVLEKNNLSTEALNVNSPQNNIYSAIQREKNKARKLVTNQSCLNRDVIQEDNNLLDLIHKIVPADNMNMTNVTNKTSINSKNNVDDNKTNDNKTDDDKWDITSIITTCNNDNVSDTYTDEEIFDTIDKKSAKESKQKTTECRIVIDKLPLNAVQGKCPIPPTEVNKQVTQKSKNDCGMSIQKRVKTFWDIDSESDLESPGTERWKPNQTVIENKNVCTENKNTQENNTSILNNSTVSEKTKLSVSTMNKQPQKKYNINRSMTIRQFMIPTKNISEDIRKPVETNVHESQNNKKKDTIKSENKKAVNTSVSARTTRTPKKNVCCTDSQPVSDNATKQKLDKKVQNKKNISPKSAENKSKKGSTSTNTITSKVGRKKLDNSIVKPKINEKVGRKKLNNSIGKPKINEKVGKKKLDNSIVKPKINECEPLQLKQTRQARKIDLSSSINTSSELTTLTFKSLRSRRIDLSDSINSSLDINKTIVNKRSRRKVN